MKNEIQKLKSVNMSAKSRAAARVMNQYAKRFIRLLSVTGFCIGLSIACAPITPLPGSTSSSPPGLPSSGGSPGGSPAPSAPPGGSQSPGGGQSGGAPSGKSGSPSGGMPGGQSGGQSSGQPQASSGGTPSGIPGGSDNEGEAKPAEPTWETEEGGDGASGDEGEWESSNEIPGGSNSAGAQGDESDSEAGQSGEGSEETADAQNGDSGDDELNGALKDFDGEILSEREVIDARAEGSADAASAAVEIPTEDPEANSEGGGNEQQTASSSPQKRSIPRAPAPPRRGSASVPDDIPDAKDDDIIARQLREAAMAEADPELKEKLWQEYRKYKKG